MYGHVLILSRDMVDKAILILGLCRDLQPCPPEPARVRQSLGDATPGDTNVGMPQQTWNSD